VNNISPFIERLWRFRAQSADGLSSLRNPCRTHCQPDLSDPGLIKRVSYALPVTGLIRSFVVQSFGLPDEVVQGPAHYYKDVKTITDDATDTTELADTPLFNQGR
jgi:hypothetical protein